MKVTNKAPLMALNLATIQKYLRRGLLGQVLFACLFISNAYALDEICGDGLMDNATQCQTANGGSACVKGSCPTGWMDSVYSDGCDLLCPDPDKDSDGYITPDSYSAHGTKISDVQDALGLDCDDTDKTIFPNQWTTKGCLTGYVRKCQTDGTYTSCTNAPPCEATGSGSCYYIDPVNGLDANPGTISSPWKTLEPFAYNYGGDHKTKTPGDVYYLRGGTYSEFYNTGSENGGENYIFACRDSNGTAANPITIRAYPGETPIITAGERTDVNLCFRFIQSCEYWNVMGLTFDGCWNGGIVVGGDHITIENNIAKNTSAEDDNDNPSGFTLASGTTGNTITNNYAADNYSRVAEGNQPNNTNILMWQGDNASIRYNVSHYTSVMTSDGRINVKWKHGTADTNIAVSAEIIGNTIIGGAKNLQTSQRETEIAFNRFFGFDNNGTSVAIEVADLGGYAFSQHIDIHDNLFRGIKTAYVPSFPNIWPSGTGRDALGIPHDVQFRRNIILRANNDSGETGGHIKGDYYLTDSTLYDDIMAALSLDYNCYYNSGTPSHWSIAGATNYGTTGFTDMTLGDWQARGFDTHSYVENPSLDTFQIGTSTNCTDMGWRTALTGSGSSSSSSSSLSIQGRSRQACFLN